MVSAWTAGIVAAIAAQPAGSAAPDPFEPVPAACERLHAVLADVASRHGVLGYDRLDEITTEPCRKVIDAGQWPALVPALGDSEDTTLRTVLCLLAPPGAIPVATKWLLAREYTSDDAGCALMVLHGAPEAFERIASERFFLPDVPPRTDMIVRQLARRMTADERIWLLPALEFATKNKEDGRDDLYARVCVAPRARAAHACADFPPTLNPLWARQEKWREVGPWYAGHIAAALAYASWAIVAYKRRGKEAVGWRFAGIGAAAVFVVATWLIVIASPREEGGLNAVNELFAIGLSLPAIAVGFAVAWAFVRFQNASPAFLSVVEAMTYVLLIIAYGARHG